MKFTPARAVAVAATVLAAAAATSVAPAMAGTHAKEYSLRSEFAVPSDIAAGPDGAVYAPDGSLGRLWRVSTSGRVSYTELGGGPAGVATGPDGALWVTDRSLDRIVRVTPRGSVTAYPLPHTRSFPTDIVAGPDGAMWFTESRGDRIGRITMTGAISEYPLATPGAFAADIAVGPDGALWFTEQSGNKVGRVTTTGELTEYAMPADSQPGSIAAGPDGALYVAEGNANSIARVSTAGIVTARFPLPAENAIPLGLAFAGDELWIGQHAVGSLGRMRLDGSFGPDVRTKSAPDSLTIGPDGDLWYASGNEGRIGRVDLLR